TKSECLKKSETQNPWPTLPASAGWAAGWPGLDERKAVLDQRKAPARSAMRFAKDSGRATRVPCVKAALCHWQTLHLLTSPPPVFAEFASFCPVATCSLRLRAPTWRIVPAVPPSGGRLQLVPWATLDLVG